MLQDYDKFIISGGQVQVDLASVSSPHIINLNPMETNDKYTIMYERKISKSELIDMKMDQIPGFRIKWYFSEDLVPLSPTKIYPYNIMFARCVKKIVKF